MPVDAWERIYTYSKQFQGSIHKENVWSEHILFPKKKAMCVMNFRRNNGHNKFLSHTPSCQRLLNMDSCPLMHSRIKIRGCLTRCLQGSRAVHHCCQQKLLSTKTVQMALLRLFTLMNRWCLKPYGILYSP